MAEEYDPEFCMAAHVDIANRIMFIYPLEKQLNNFIDVIIRYNKHQIKRNSFTLQNMYVCYMNDSHTR